MKMFNVLGHLDTVIFLGMLICLVVLSKQFAGKGGSAAKEFATGGKRFGLVLTIGSCFATYMGAYTVGGHIELVMASGLVALTIIFGCNVGWILLTVLAKPLRESNADTMAEFVRIKYDITTQRAASAMSVLKCIGSLAGQIIAIGTLFAVLGLGSRSAGIVFGGIIIMLLTILGGYKGVAITNNIQGIFIAIICCFVIPAMSLSKVGGFGAMLANTPVEMKSLISGPEMPAAVAFGLFLSTTMSFGVEPAMIQRVLSAKDTKTAVKSSVVSNIVSLILVLPLTAGAMCSRLIFPALDTGTKFFPMFITTYLPPVIKGIALFSLISMFLTTGDSYLHVGASNVLVDFIKASYPEIDDRKATRAAQLTIVVMTFSAILLSLWGGQIYKVMLLAGGAYGAAVIFPILLACFSNRQYDYRWINRGIYTAAVVTVLWEVLLKSKTGLSGCLIGLPVNIVLCMIHSHRAKATRE